MIQQYQKPYCIKYLGIIGFLFLVYTLQAQGIKGKIVDVNGDPLPFASVILMGTTQGLVSNIEGDFVLPLAPGTHRIRFQYLGYSHLDTTFHVGSTYISFRAVMQPEVVALPEAMITSNGEDPAYTIMRRAIAKAKYHSLQVDEYNAMVYVKGSGRLLKVPALFRKRINKALAEEGIDSTVAFAQESISKLHYIRPDQYRDTVISIRTSGEDNNTSPMSFVYSSFYEPEVVGGISPLAPDAFSHYRFEYLGYIQDGDHVVNKIKVIPRAKGDSVFEGVIYIVDNVWSIHSLDLETYIWGIRFDIQQQFEPLLPDVWLPVHEIYDVDGSVFGFAFEYRYFAKLTDYDIKLNPDLEVPVVVLDAKVETEEAKASEQKLRNQSFENGLTGLDTGEELSVKQLRKMMKEYEKQEIEALPETDTIEYVNSSVQVIDSTAYKFDSTYWEEVRPLPLTDYEVKGYARQDSIAAIPPDPAKEGEEEQDSVSVIMSEDGFVADVKRRSKFEMIHLITGGRYNLSDKTYFKLKGLTQTLNFNTIDGFHFGYGFEFGDHSKKPTHWEAGTFIRYAISREAFNYEGRVRLFGKKWSLLLNAGDMTRQFNYDKSIYPWANSLYTLFVNRNYMKIYEQKFASIDYRKDISPAFGFELSGEYAKRERLENTTDLVFFDNKNLLYTSNDPFHLAGDANVFNDHDAIISDVSAWIKPIWHYKVSRGTKRKDYSQSPRLTMRYRRGWGEENHAFDLISAQFESEVFIGAGSQLSMHINAGKFIGENAPKYFHDFVHFPGSRMIGAPVDPSSAFRMLDYYTYSTDNEYAYGLFNYQFRRMMLTQFETFRRHGIRENVILNMLYTPESNRYAEVGYAINYILRVFRVEFITSWQDFTYQDFAIRVGIATDFDSLFRNFD